MCPYHYVAHFSLMIRRGMERRRRDRGELDDVSRLAVSRVVQYAACYGLGRREEMQSFHFDEEESRPMMERVFLSCKVRLLPYQSEWGESIGFIISQGLVR